MGVLIGGIIGLIIGSLILAARNKKAKAHADGVNALVAKPGGDNRAALDRRIPKKARIDNDQDVELQSQRLAVLANLGDFAAVEQELAAYKGTPTLVATVKIIGHSALAVKGHDATGNAARVEAECAGLEAAGTNALTRRALVAWLPIARAAAGLHTLTDAERDEARRFQASDVVKGLI